MPGNYSHTNRADGTVLTAAIYNQDHQNHINNMTPAGVDDYSSNVTEMRAATDPGETGSESFATSLAGEIERLRFAVQDIKTYLGLHGAHWYNSPSGRVPPSLIDDHSTDVTQMRATTDPGSGGSESLPTDLRGELERIRYTIKQTKDALSPVTYWYDPVTPPTVGPAGAYVRGLYGSASGNTITLSAKEVLVRRTNGEHKWLSGISDITCNITTHGVNGRDQASAFPSDSWLYVYYIWNGTTTALLASLTGLPTGPTLPSGYTHFALATIVRMTGTSIRASYITGRYVGWGEKVEVSNDTAQVTTYTETTCPYTEGMESTALELNLSGTAPASDGSYNYTGVVSLQTTGDVLRVNFIVYRWGNTNGMASRNTTLIPSRPSYYRLHTRGGGSSTMTIQMCGYTVQNGA